MSAITSISTVATKYKEEFVDTFGSIKNRARHVSTSGSQIASEIKNTIEPYQKDFIKTAQTMDNVSTPPGIVLEVLAWSTVLHTIASISAYLSAKLFSHILSVFIGLWGALFGVIVGTPVYGYYTIKAAMASGASDREIRFQLLMIAISDGIQMGYLLQNSFLLSTPCAALSVGLTTIIYPIASRHFGNKRQQLLGLSAGGPLCLMLLFGLMLGKLTSAFVLLILLYGISVAMTLQYIYKGVSGKPGSTYFYQLGLLVGTNISYLLVHLCFGMNEEQ